VSRREFLSMRLTSHFLPVAAALAMLALAGCAATKLQPWDRDLLSEQKMQFAPSPVENEIDQHIYFSKEASTGGSGVGGGGCGCN